MNIIDLTHPIKHSMQGYPGDPPALLNQIRNIARDRFTDHQLTISMHVGTHIDGMWHMVDDKRFIADLPVEQFIGKACVIDIRNTNVFSDIELVIRKSEDCSIILFYTGMGQFFGTDGYLNDYPVIDPIVAEAITNSNIKMIGIDSCSPDKPPYLIHKILLNKGIVIAENLTNLDRLIQAPQFTIFALPLRIEADSAPARIIALIE